MGRVHITPSPLRGEGWGEGDHGEREAFAAQDPLTRRLTAPPSPQRGEGRHTNLCGIALIVAAFALFSVVDGLMKHLTSTYPLVQAVFFNAAFSLIPIVGFALARGGPRMLATRRPGVQLLRGIIGGTAGVGAFFAFARMPMADVYAILFASPLVITALAGPMLGERVGPRRWAAVLAGFAGVLFMLRPSGAMNAGALGALVSAVCFSLSALIVRRAGQTETAPSWPFYGNLLAVALLAPMQPFVWLAPDPADLPLLVGTGLVAGVALLCLMAAFRMAPGPVVAPFQYTQMLWGVLFGALIFGDAPDPSMALGAATVILSGLYILRRESRA
ncbi:MAG TPA: DMT family transporter [Azospirillum sp.]|nr:DMT family transporter [Azospirillum sp.]